MKTRNLFQFVVITLIGLSACSQGTQASTTYTTVSEGSIKPGDAVPAPAKDVILKVDGKISHKNNGDALEFDLANLEKVGLVEYDVDDPFVKKNIKYTGVLISQLLKVAGAASDATTLTLRALDDYSVDMKLEDAVKWPVMVAIKADGEYMPIDKNGPLISVFPFNDFPELDHLTYDAFWVWSLAGITVK